MDSSGESFFFYGLFFYPEFLALVPSATNPVQQLTFLLSISADGRSPHFRFGVPANHLASLFFLLVSGDLSEVTKYQHLLVSPLWPTFFLNGHSLTAYCSFKREDSINLISIVSVGHHVTIVIHRQRVSIYSVARHAGRSKPGSKPVQLYVNTFRNNVTGWLFTYESYILLRSG